jgi:hypothetical protein
MNGYWAVLYKTREEEKRGVEAGTVRKSVNAYTHVTTISSDVEFWVMQQNRNLILNNFLSK